MKIVIKLLCYVSYDELFLKIVVGPITFATMKCLFVNITDVTLSVTKCLSISLV